MCDDGKHNVNCVYCNAMALRKRRLEGLSPPMKEEVHLDSLQHPLVDLPEQVERRMRDIKRISLNRKQRGEPNHEDGRY